MRRRRAAVKGDLPLLVKTGTAIQTNPTGTTSGIRKLGRRASSVQEVVHGRMLAKVTSIIDDSSHRLHHAGNSLSRLTAMPPVQDWALTSVVSPTSHQTILHVPTVCKYTVNILVQKFRRCATTHTTTVNMQRDTWCFIYPYLLPYTCLLF